MMFSFVTRNGEDILQEVLLPCGGTDRPLEDQPCDPGAFGHRVVFGFFEGQFTADELNRFMQDLASAPGSAPMANNYFKSYNEDSRVNTGGISFEKNMRVPPRFLEIIEEYRDVKFIDKLVFLCIQAEWFGALRSLQAMRLPMHEP